VPLSVTDIPNTCAARGATWKGAPPQPWAAGSRRNGNAGKAKSRKRAIAIRLSKGRMGGIKVPAPHRGSRVIPGRHRASGRLARPGMRPSAL